MPFMDLTDLPFGRLIALERGPNRGQQTQWWCQCVCGNRCLVSVGNLRSGMTQSCGCLVKEHIGQVRRTHGLSHTPEHNIWCLMRARCTNPKRSGFVRYGARGITVCERWNHSFQNFLADMGKRPTPQHTLERKDNDGPYSPENCVWASLHTQARNRRNNRYITLDGTTKCLVEWLAIKGIRTSTYTERRCRGWSAERALTTPVRRLKPR